MGERRKKEPTHSNIWWHKCTFLLQIKDWLSSRSSFPAAGIAHFSVTPAAALTAETPSRAQVRHLNCWGSLTLPRQSRSTLWVELIKGRFSSPPSVVQSIHSQWLEILDQVQHQVQHLVQPRPETDIQRSTPVKPPFPTVENLRIVTAQYIALLLLTWAYKYISLTISFPAKLPFFTLQPPTWLSMHSKEKGCMTCCSQQDTRSEKQGSQSTGTVSYCWQYTILTIIIFFFLPIRIPWREYQHKE